MRGVRHVSILLPLAATLLLLSPASAGPPRTCFDFEQDRAGGPPADWFSAAPPESRATVEIVKTGAATGRKCLRIARASESGTVNIGRTIDVGAYRGMRILLRAALRVEAGSPSGRAQLWLRIDDAAGNALFLENMDDRPVRSPRWSRHEITAVVPEAAAGIHLGLLVFGRTEVWLDDVTISASPHDPAEEREGVAVVLVKDFLRLENSGETLEEVEFPRYSPAIDEEQVVLGRWVEGRTDDGDPIPVSIARVDEDPAANLLPTFRVARLPARTGVVVTVSTLVLRRERPPPRGSFPILAADCYPEAVRPYLRSTPCVNAVHPEIRGLVVALRARTDDAYELAGILADLMRRKSYLPTDDPDWDLPTSVFILRHGGSCCASAVSAAAILRAAGIPAQITYCPAGYVHGIVRFWLRGHGWCRMDSTCSVGRVPLVKQREHRGLVRLYDMPIEMETQEGGYGWPYQHNTVESADYRFRAKGEVVRTVRFAAHDLAEARREKRVAGRVSEPFSHLEPGSWSKLLSIEPWELGDLRWTKLVETSRPIAKTTSTGVFGKVLERLGTRARRGWLEELLARARTYGALPGGH
jgi:transglutaminase-like putative cysteine protease